MLGIIFCIIAGSAMSIQGVMNTRLGDKIGLYEANVFVQATALVLSIIACLVLGSGSLKHVLEIKKIYLLGGIFALVITITVMLGIKNLSPTVAISIILIAQVFVAALIDAFGFLDSEKIVFHWTKYIALAFMIGGVVLFKLKS